MNVVLELDTPIFSFQELRAYGVVDSFVLPRVVFADNISMSIQCHAGAYAQPRLVGWRDVRPLSQRVTHVEVGFPDVKIAALMPYIEIESDDADPTESVYPYVPVEVIDAMIAEHGGIVQLTSYNGIIKMIEGEAQC